MNKKLVKRIIGAVVVIFVAYLLMFEVLTYLGEQALQATGIKRYEFTEAVQIAKDKDRFILADMSAIWCPTCRKLDQKIFSDESVKKFISEYYIFTRIEYESDQGKGFMKKYGIKGFPTLLILDKDENKLSLLPLTFEPEIFIGYLSDFIEMHELSQN